MHVFDQGFNLYVINSVNEFIDGSKISTFMGSSFAIYCSLLKKNIFHCSKTNMRSLVADEE